MIQLNQVAKVFARRAHEVRGLDDVTLHIRPGQFIVIRGPSGCGKTTLLLTMGGMLHPTRGSIVAKNHDLYALNGRDRARFRAEHIGFVFQMFHLVPYLSVRDNVALAASGPVRTANATRADTLIDQLGLQSRANHLPAELSAGERQRTAIARALLHTPAILLADEPTGNLDPDNADEVFCHLHTYNQNGGTVVVVTHGAAADRFAHRVLTMHQGRLVE